MSRKPAAKCIAVLTSGLVLAWLAAVRPPTPRADAGDAKKQPGGSKLERLFYGNVKACGTDGCHGNSTPVGEKQATYKGFSSVFARRHELHLWETEDKHKIATKVLRGERGRRMAELLHIKGDITDPSTQKTNLEWKQCLTCHGVVIEDVSEVHKSFGPEDRLESGVSCVVCHGPYKNWVG